MLVQLPSGQVFSHFDGQRSKVKVTRDKNLDTRNKLAAGSPFVTKGLFGYWIRSGCTVNLGSDSLGKTNDLSLSSVSRIHFGFGFIVNPDPDPIIE